MKKIVSLALLLVLAVSAFTPVGEVRAAADGFAGYTHPLTVEPVTLEIFVQESESINYTYDQVNQKYYEDMTGVSIEWRKVSPSQSIYEAYNLMLASRDYPDIISHIPFTTEMVTLAADSGVIIPLNDMINKYGVNYKQRLEEDPNIGVNVTAPDGNIYTFYYTDVGLHLNTEFKMWVYEDWLTALDIPMPSTPQEFKDMLIAFRDRDPGGQGRNDAIPIMGFNETVHTFRKGDPIIFLMNPFELYNTDYFHITDDQKIRFLANTDGWRDGLRYLSDLFNEGLIAPETYVQDATQFQAILNCPKEDTVVGTFPYWASVNQIRRTERNWTDYAAVPPLMNEAGDRRTLGKPMNFVLNTAITSACENPEIAYQFLDWFLGYDGTMLSHYGVEGQSYEWVDEPAINGAARSVKKLDIGDRTFGSLIWANRAFPRHDTAEIRYGVPFSEEMINIDNTGVLYRSSKVYEPYLIMHNIPDNAWCADMDVMTKISEYKLLVNEIVEIGATNFVMGNLDINDDAQWDSYLEELESIGLTDYLETLAVYYNLP